MLDGELDEEVEAAAFKEAVAAWRGDWLKSDTAICRYGSLRLKYHFRCAFVWFYKGSKERTCFRPRGPKRPNSNIFELARADGTKKVLLPMLQKLGYAFEYANQLKFEKIIANGDFFDILWEDMLFMLKMLSGIVSIMKEGW